MPRIKAIETVFRGYRFRSRTEARYAIFFDVLGLRWDYEAEGYDLGGTWYLPDFYFPDLQAWGEVKAVRFTRHEYALAQALPGPCLLLAGAPNAQTYPTCEDSYEEYCLNQHYGRVNLPHSVHKGRFWKDYGEGLSDEERLVLTKAVHAARGARFEHGEKGGTAKKHVTRRRKHQVKRSPKK